MKKGILLLVLFIQFNVFGQCWKEVKAGSLHTIGVKLDGSLWTWGNNDFNQLD